MKLKRFKIDNDGNAWFNSLLLILIVPLIIFVIIILIEFYDKELRKFDWHMFIIGLLISAGIYSYDYYNKNDAAPKVDIVFEFEITNPSNSNFTMIIPIPIYENRKIVPFEYLSSNMIEGNCSLETIKTEYGSGVYGSGLKIYSSSSKLSYKETISINHDDYSTSRMSMSSSFRSDPVSYITWAFLDSSESATLEFNYHRNGTEKGHKNQYSIFSGNFRVIENGWHYFYVEVR